MPIKCVIAVQQARNENAETAIPSKQRAEFEMESVSFSLIIIHFFISRAVRWHQGIAGRH